MQGRTGKGGGLVAAGFRVGTIVPVVATFWLGALLPCTAAAQRIVIAFDDAFEVAEDSGNSELDVLANDVVIGGGPEVRITAVSAPANGEVSVMGGRRLRYRPNADFFGTDTFTYSIEDRDDEVATAIVTVTVTPVADPPDAADDDFTVVESSVDNAFDVLGNDVDADGDMLVVTAVTEPNRGGTVTIAEDGLALVYSPAPGFNGEETFGYTATDGSDENAARVRVTVTAVNDAPLPADDAFSVEEDSGPTALDVLANDVDPDGDALTVASVTAASGGTAAVAPGGARVTYRPRPNFTGSDSFTYTVRDATGATGSATVAITVTAVDDPPVAANDSFSVDEDSGGNVFDVLANDTDPDGGALRVTAVTTPNRGGTAAVADGGRAVSYRPAAEFSGVETFTYTVVGDTSATATATVTVNVASSNDAPVIEPDPIPDQTAQEALPFSLDLAQFVSDADDPAANLVYARVDAGQLPPGLTLSGAGLLSGTPQIGTSVGEHTLRFSVSDGTETTTSEPFKLTVLRAGRVDLSVSVTAEPNPALPSETVTWTFSIANLASDTPASSVRLEIDVTGNAAFSFDTAAAQGCTTTGGGSGIVCNIASAIAGGGIADVALTGRGTSPGEAGVSATVSIAAPAPIDEVESNDTATATLSIAEALSGPAAQRIDGIDARAAAAGDLNGDGRDDLVVATGPAQATLVFFNVVDPANEHKRMLSTTPLALGQPGADNDVAVVDVDGDGDLDVVTAAGGGRGNMLFTNDGAGAFSGQTLPGPAGGSAVAAGDFDGDGFVDLVFVRPGADTALRGAGSSFLAATAFGNGDSRDVAIANLFGNAVPEVIVANANGDAQIYRGAGGGLELDRTLPTGPTTSVTAADLDGDGFADLVFGKEPTGGAPQAVNVVFMNAAAAGGGLVPADEIGSAPTVAVASTDADLDGDTDVVFVNRTGAHQLFVNAGNGAAQGGRFALHPQQVAMPRAVSAVAASLGSDDRVDLALVGSTGIAVYYNDGAGNFGLGDTQAPTLRLNGVPDVTLRVGNAYADAGATAVDAEDGDVSDRIRVTNPVDTAVIGTYEILYEVTDKSGNPAAPLSRTVRVAAAEGQVGGGGGGGAAGALLTILLALAAVRLIERRLAGVRSARAGTPC